MYVESSKYYSIHKISSLDLRIPKEETAKVSGTESADGEVFSMKNVNLLAVTGLLFVGVNLQAHHSASVFDQDVEMTIEGSIVEYEWANPHVYLWVEEESENGELVRWEIEAQPPLVLKGLGWTQETLAVGDRVMVLANPTRNPERKAVLMKSIELSDQTVIETSFQEIFSVWAAEAQKDFSGTPTTSLSGNWVTLFDRATIGALMAPRRAFSLTDEGLASIDSFDEDTESPALDCIASPAPLNMVVPDIKSIEVEEDLVLISGESDGFERIVYLNSSHAGATESLQGHSIGWWDEGVLVIDTTNFAENRSGNAPGLSSSAGKHLVERLELNEEGTHINYSFTLEDPEFLAEPFIRETRFVYSPDEEIIPLPCDLENARRYLE